MLGAEKSHVADPARIRISRRHGDDLGLEYVVESRLGHCLSSSACASGRDKGEFGFPRKGLTGLLEIELADRRLPVYNPALRNRR
jgi:hypothetical protein